MACRCAEMKENGKQRASLSNAFTYLSTYKCDCESVSKHCGNVSTYYTNMLGTTDDVTQYVATISGLGDDLANYASQIGSKITAKSQSLLSAYKIMDDEDKLFHDEEKREQEELRKNAYQNIVTAYTK